MIEAHAEQTQKPIKPRMTVAEVFAEYCENGRCGKAYGTTRKQDSLWNNHIYSRNYLDVDTYNTLFVNKNTKIHMPKRKIDEDDEIVSFSIEGTNALDKYFKDTNAETAYLLGRYCGLRINECYGLLWSNIYFDNDCIHIEQQMQYREGLIILSPLKTRNAKRTLYMHSKLKKHLLTVKEIIMNRLLLYLTFANKTRL